MTEEAEENVFHNGRRGIETGTEAREGEGPGLPGMEERRREGERHHRRVVRLHQPRHRLPPRLHLRRQLLHRRHRFH